MSPHIVIVGADKGGVGKTTVSRTLIDYFQSRGLSLRAFDTEYPTGALNRFHPDKVQLVNIEDSEDQVKVFDGLSSAQVTLIDIRAGLFSKTLAWLALLGFLEGVKDGSLRISVVHVIGSNKASFDEIGLTTAAVQGAKHHVLLNHTNRSKFGGLPTIVGDPIQVHLLDELAASTVDIKGMGFAAYLADEAGQSRTLRGYVNAWLKSTFAEYDRVGLNTV
jgi:hypothetical protein